MLQIKWAQWDFWLESISTISMGPIQCEEAKKLLCIWLLSPQIEENTQKMRIWLYTFITLVSFELQRRVTPLWKALGILYQSYVKVWYHRSKIKGKKIRSWSSAYKWSLRPWSLIYDIGPLHNFDRGCQELSIEWSHISVAQRRPELWRFQVRQVQF